MTAKPPSTANSIGNRDLRRLWLAANRLVASPSGPVNAATVIGIIRDLGFLQIDTVRNVVRAQDHILWSRNRNYRERMLWPLLKQRLLFEHFTHDASLIPMEIYPLWQRQFRRLGERAANAAWYRSGMDGGEIAALRDRIVAEGPLSTHAFDSTAESREMWARKPHKKALEQMWYAGVLATAERRNFVKYYDLGERVFPPLPSGAPDEAAAGAALCELAMERLWVASPGEIRKFWEALPPAEVAAWARDSDLVPVRIESADGRWQEAFALPDIETRLADVPPLTSQVHIINPFDPAIRDRVRLKRIFGFDYTNEMFVPAARRRWGYYVYPLMEGDRFVGRIEAKCDRSSGVLRVTGFWPEAGVRWGQGRMDRLRVELDRFARLAGLTAAPFAR
ncbi:MAG: crosslink repair DNA glycosylase YcaQ family protein [Pseudomonadota bacterium]|nr:crosslink repair DNA glycosylase YcaQ family protein [Pseudomonadota bacterium]